MIQRISKEDLKQRLEGSEPPVVIDARLKYPYEHSTVRSAGCDSLSRAIPPRLSLPRDREIVVYDSDPYELASSHVAAVLSGRGFARSRSRAASPSGSTANLPTETKDAPKQSTPEPGALKG